MSKLRLPITKEHGKLVIKPFKLSKKKKSLRRIRPYREKAIK